MTFDPVWAADGEVSAPSEAEIRAGFSCGPLTNTRLNWIVQILMSAINDVDVDAGVPLSRQVATSEGIQGGGDLSNDLLLRLNIDGLEVESAIANDDLIAIFDASAGVHRAMTRANFVSGLGGGGGGGDISGGANIGTGGGEVFASVSGSNLQFRKILHGVGLNVTTVDNDVVIAFASLPSPLTVD